MTTPAELDASMGSSNTRGIFGFGTSGFAAIRTALSEYQKLGSGATPEAMAQQAKLLGRLDDLCTRWLNEHPAARPGSDASRRQLVARLLDEIPMERFELSKRQAQDIYLANVANKGQQDGKDPHTRFGLEAITAASTGAARRARGGDRGYQMGAEGQKLAAAHGLTPAEQVAIVAYSDDNYKYINPATANKPAWMKSQAEGTPGEVTSASVHGWDKLHATDAGRKTLREEGALHSGVAMQGLTKLPPFKGSCFRGAAYSQASFDERVALGKTLTFPSLTSSSKNIEVGLGWANKTTDTDDIAVLSVFSSTDGRDISSMSMYEKEQEVLILPGTSFVATSVKEVTGGSSGYPELDERMKASKARKWYVVQFDPAPKPGAWKGASTTASKLPSSTPIEEMLRQAGTPARGAIGQHR